MGRLVFSCGDAAAGQQLQAVPVKEGEKVLAVALRAKMPIRFGCASGRCGVYAVRVVSGDFSPMKIKEKELLKRMGILEGVAVRLSCQLRTIQSGGEVDLSFQKSYDPSERDGDDSCITYEDYMAGSF